MFGVLGLSNTGEVKQQKDKIIVNYRMEHRLIWFITNQGRIAGCQDTWPERLTGERDRRLLTGAWNEDLFLWMDA